MDSIGSPVLRGCHKIIWMGPLAQALRQCSAQVAVWVFYFSGEPGGEIMADASQLMGFFPVKKMLSRGQKAGIAKI